MGNKAKKGNFIMAKQKARKVKYPIQKKRLYTVDAGSLLDLQRRGKLWLGSFLIGQYIEKRCHWDKGRTFRIKGAKEISQATGYCVRHVYRCIDQLKEVGWLKDVAPAGASYWIFEIYPFGEEARKARQTTAAPLDASDPLALLGEGKISRTACALWHFANIDWQERLGESVPKSLRGWAEDTSLSARAIWEVFKDESCALFQRISETTHATVVKVFPFLDPPESTDRRSLSEAAIQASYSEVVFTDDGVATYRGEQYRRNGEWIEQWRAKDQFWVYSSLGVPEEVKAAFADRT